jgi:Kelch motif
MAKLIGSAILLALCIARLFAAEGAWIALAPAGDPRQEVGAAELNGKIYIIGGLPSTNRVQEYDPATNTWRIVASLPIAVDHPGATSLGGKLYVMGGNTANGSTNALFEYDPATDQWTPRPSMPTARNALGSVAISGKIYAVGGTGTGVTGRELEVFDPGTGMWTQLQPMPTGRNHLAAGTIGGKLYVAGGRPGNLAALEVFDPATNTWTPRAPMPTARSGHAGAVVRDKFYTFGGEGNPNSPIGIFREAEVYDPATDSWKSLDPMPTPRHGIGAAAIGNRIYIPAGATQAGGGSHTGANEAFVVQPEKLFFAHFASGSGISTETVVGNPVEGRSSLVTAELFDQSGNPLQADLGGSTRSTATALVDALGSLTLRSADPGSTLRVGSLLISSELPASGTVLFASSLPGFRGLAAVGASPPLARFFVAVQRDPFGQIDSGIALSNTTETAVTVTLVLRNETGASLASRTLSLPPRGQFAAFLTQVFPTADIVTFTFRGTVTAISTGPVAALALLFTSNEFATLPVVPY